jgi:hypothetical protein
VQGAAWARMQPLRAFELYKGRGIIFFAVSCVACAIGLGCMMAAGWLSLRDRGFNRRLVEKK